MRFGKRIDLLLLADELCIFFAYSLARFFYTGIFTFVPDHPFQLVACVAFPFCFYVADLYYPYKFFTRARTLVEAAMGVSAGALLLAACAYLDKSFTTPRLIFSYMALVLVPLVYATRRIYDFIFKFHMLDKKTVILGTGPLAADLARILKDTPHTGMDFIGFITEKRKQEQKTVQGLPVLGALSNLLSVIDWYNIQLVVLALDPHHDISEVEIMSDLLKRQVSVTSGIHLLENLTGEIPYRLLGTHYLLGLMSHVRMNPYLKVKRAIDVSAAVLVGAALAPVLLVAMVALYVSGGGKVFFVQKRVGLKGKPFSLVKLRSMTAAKNGRVKVTPVGKWIRKFRIDEIPQIWNVFKGDMSIVGPRPEVPYFVERSRKKIPFYDTIFAVKPGLSGWAQINLPHVTSIKDYDRKFRYNLFYLKNLSLTLDLIILIRTIRVVLLGKGK